MLNYISKIDWYKVPDELVWGEVAGISIDHENRVIVFVRGETPVIILSTAGEYIDSFGKGEFTNRAHSVRVDSENFYWFVDDGNHTVSKYNSKGKRLLTIGVPNKPSELHSGIPFNRCTDIAIDYKNGALFISDGYGNSSVHKYNLDGELITSWGSPGTDPGHFNIVHNITMDDSGLLYVADRENHRVQIFDQDGKFINQIVNMHRPCTVTIYDNKLYVGELGYGLPVNKDVPNIGPRISLYSLGGELIDRWGEGFGYGEKQLMAPHGLTVDNDNNIYLGEVCVAVLGSLGLKIPQYNGAVYNGLRKLEKVN